MVATFGWSAGDIVVSIKIIYHVLEAFKTSKGASKQYEDSRNFLNAFIPILRRLVEFSQDPDNENDQFRADLLSQGEIIGDSYARFEQYLEKHHGLSSRRYTITITAIVQTVKWSLRELDEKVMKLKRSVANAMLFLDPLLSFEITCKVREIASSIKCMQQRIDRDNSKPSQVLLQGVNTLLGRTETHISSLEQASSSYKAEIDKSLAALKQDTDSQLDQLQIQIKSNTDVVKGIEDLQSRLERSLVSFTKQIEQQRKVAPPSQMREWETCRQRAEAQTASLKAFHSLTQETLHGLATTLNGISRTVDWGLISWMAPVSARLFGASSTLTGIGNLAGCVAVGQHLWNRSGAGQRVVSGFKSVQSTAQKSALSMQEGWMQKVQEAKRGGTGTEDGNSGLTDSAIETSRGAGAGGAAFSVWGDSDTATVEDHYSVRTKTTMVTEVQEIGFRPDGDQSRLVSQIQNPNTKDLIDLGDGGNTPSRSHTDPSLHTGLLDMQYSESIPQLQGNIAIDDNPWR